MESSKAKLNKLFVGSIPMEVVDKELREHFGKYGHLVDLVLIKDKHTKKSRGFGFVTFKDRKMMKQALRSKQRIRGVSLEVKLAEPKKTSKLQDVEDLSRISKVFVGGVPKTATVADLRACFEKYGAIADATLIEDKKTNEPRGFGFIMFEDPNSAKKVIEDYSSHHIMDKWVECKIALPKSVSAFADGGLQQQKSMTSEDDDSSSQSSDISIAQKSLNDKTNQKSEKAQPDDPPSPKISLKEQPHQRRSQIDVSNTASPPKQYGGQHTVIKRQGYQPSYHQTEFLHHNRFTSGAELRPVQQHSSYQDYSALYRQPFDHEVIMPPQRASPILTSQPHHAQTANVGAFNQQQTRYEGFQMRHMGMQSYNDDFSAHANSPFRNDFTWSHNVLPTRTSNIGHADNQPADSWNDDQKRTHAAYPDTYYQQMGQPQQRMSQKVQHAQPQPQPRPQPQAYYTPSDMHQDSHAAGKQFNANPDVMRQGNAQNFKAWGGPVFYGSQTSVGQMPKGPFMNSNGGRYYNSSTDLMGSEPPNSQQRGSLLNLTSLKEQPVSEDFKASMAHTRTTKFPVDTEAVINKAQEGGRKPRVAYISPIQEDTHSEYTVIKPNADLLQSVGQHAPLQQYPGAVGQVQPRGTNK